MNEFILIDLDSQYDEVSIFIAAKPIEHILEWLQQFGEVTHINHPYDNALYGFRSSTGISTGFRLTQDGKLTLVRPHSTVRK